MTNNAEMPGEVWVGDGWFESGYRHFLAVETEIQYATSYTRTDLVTPLVQALDGMLEANKRTTYPPDHPIWEALTTARQALDAFRRT